MLTPSIKSDGVSGGRAASSALTSGHDYDVVVRTKLVCTFQCQITQILVILRHCFHQVERTCTAVVIQGAEAIIFYGKWTCRVPGNEQAFIADGGSRRSRGL